MKHSARRAETITRLWLSYVWTVLDDAEPCMEANEGAFATLSLASRYKSLSGMEVRNIRRTTGECYELKRGSARLWLTETEAGDVFLSFFQPQQNPCIREDSTIDLTYFGSDTAAYFIATVFESYEYIVNEYCRQDWLY
ncbi:MAG: hypothetical protein IKX60_08990 [Bacteroidales bacterium]|nr:hypothetical protein [Bacteroidales bacterium]